MLRANGRSPLKRADPLRVAVLCSARAPGLTTLLSVGDAAEFRVVGVMTTDPASTALPNTAGTQVPCVVHDIAGFYRASDARSTDLSVRPGYDTQTVRLVKSWNADLVVLCAYLHILTRPVLDAFPGRVFNIHDSDLCLTGPDGRPRYRGLRSTRDAILGGEPETRSTVHVVTEEVDVGPLLVRSWPFPVHLPLVQAARNARAADALKAYAYAQREWMMRASWGLMLQTTLELLTRGELRPGTPITLEPERRGDPREDPARAGTSSHVPPRPPAPLA